MDTGSLLKTMEKNLDFRYPSVTADSGYESEEAYTYLRSVKQKPYIKPRSLRNGRSEALNRTSANGKIWDMMKRPIHTPAMLENRYLLFL